MGIIWTIVLGFVIGVIAKFLHPGKEGMGFLPPFCSASPAPSPPAWSGNHSAGIGRAKVPASSLR